MLNVNQQNTGCLYVDGEFICRIPNEVNINNEITLNNITYNIDRKIFPIDFEEEKPNEGVYHFYDINFKGSFSYRVIVINIRNSIKKAHNIDILNYAPDYVWNNYRSRLRHYIFEWGGKELLGSRLYKWIKNEITGLLKVSPMVVDDIIEKLWAKYE